MNNHLPSAALTIRPATFTDIDSIRHVALETWPATYEEMLGKEQVEYMLERLYNKEALEEQIKNQHYFFLALKDYTPVGFASFNHTDGTTYKLQKIYVLPSEQGTGTGLALLKTVETVVKSMEGTRLQLNVNRINKARNFYEKNGFAIIEQVDIDIENGFWMNDYIMEKKLDE